MVTKDVWNSLSKKDQKAKVVEALEQLYAIEHGKHALSGKLEQGRLANVKKDLEAFLIDTADWQSNKIQQQRQLK